LLSIFEPPHKKRKKTEKIQKIKKLFEENKKISMREEYIRTFRKLPKTG